MEVDMIATCCGAWYFTQLIPPDALPLKNHPVQNVTFKLETQTHWTVQNKNATINDSNHVNINKHLKKHHTLQSWDSLEPSGMIYGKHSKNQRTPPHQWPQSQESAIICHSFWKKQTTHGESGVCSHVALNIFESIGHWNGSCHGSFRHETYESRWAVLQDEVSQPSARRETRSRYSGCKTCQLPWPQRGAPKWHGLVMFFLAEIPWICSLQISKLPTCCLQKPGKDDDSTHLMTCLCRNRNGSSNRIPISTVQTLLRLEISLQHFLPEKFLPSNDLTEQRLNVPRRASDEPWREKKMGVPPAITLW